VLAALLSPPERDALANDPYWIAQLVRTDLADGAVVDDSGFFLAEHGDSDPARILPLNALCQPVYNR
jgi:hypothetical protein